MPFWSKMMLLLFLCLLHQQNEFHSVATGSHKKNIKVVGGKHNVLVLYVDASAPNPSGVVLCNPFIWDILYSYLIKNHVVVFVPSTPAKWISFRNQRNRKVVGGNHNVLLLYVDASTPDSSGVVLCNPFIWDILYSFLIKNHVVVGVPSTTVKWILFCNHSTGVE